MRLRQARCLSPINNDNEAREARALQKAVMNMAFEGNDILSLGYRAEGVSGIGAHLAVVAGTADDQVKLPGAANAAGFVGFSLDAQATEGKHISVREAGTCIAIAAGAIDRGNLCKIAGTSGKITPIATTGATAQEVVCEALQTVTTDGDQVLVKILKVPKVYPALT